MIIPRLNIWLAMLMVAGLQTAALGYMVVDRASLLQNGREITLDVKPVDPRSLFRGDYVILNYGDIGRVDKAYQNDLPKGPRAVFVKLVRNGEEWIRSGVTDSYPASVGAEAVVLKGTVANRHTNQVRYGIESYFVPEGEGKRLEKLIGKGQLKVIVAVAPDGRTGIKGLEVEGKRIYDEPVW